MANIFALLGKISSRARQESYRSDDSSHWLARYTPFANRSSVSSGSGRERLNEVEEDSQFTSTRELPVEDRQAAARASGLHDGETVASPQTTRTTTRNDTGASTIRSDSTKVGQDSPTDSEKPYYGTDGDKYTADPEAISENPSDKKRSVLQRLTGRGKKDKKPEKRHTDSEDPKKNKKHFGFLEQLKVVLFGSYINVLLICVPIGIALHLAEANPYASFAVNFVAIIPLAGILSFATEELSLRVGETLGGLLNASFGNAVELIVSIIALFQNKIIIVQTSLIGSILSNLLLVLGMCFFFGGLQRMEQFFNTTVAQTSASLLALAVGTLIIPTCFKRFGTGGDPNSAQTPAEQRQAQIPALSRGLSVMLLIVYIAFLIFQLKSHSTMFSETGGVGSSRPVRDHEDKSALRQKVHNIRHRNDDEEKLQSELDKEEEPEQNRLSKIGAIFTLCAATALIGVTSEYMVDGVTPMAQVISPEFIGLILIPIVGNAAEHFTAVTVACKDKMDLAIGVAVGSSMQISLLVLPLVVLIGWFANKDE